MTIKEQIQELGTSEGGRLDAHVARLLGWPRARVRGLIGHGGVSVNGQAGRDGGAMLSPGDRLHLRYDPERKYREEAVARPTHGYSIVYVDEALVVVEKDAGLLTVPTERGESQTLVGLLSRHLAKGQKRGGRAYVVHRLDRDTSGLLVFGRSHKVADALIDQFAARKPAREYTAIVAGLVTPAAGTMRGYLRTDRALNQVSTANEDEGELAISHFSVLEHYRDTSLVEVRLETGRRNQIRAQFAQKGHPVLGDLRYEAEKAAHRGWPYKRLALHARSLGFTHPVTGKALRFEAALPSEFGKFARGALRPAGA